MNGKGIAEAYREFQQDRSQETEEFLTHEIYRSVMAWLQNGHPEERFLNELMEISASYEEPSFRGGNLLELSLWELMEVVHAFNGIPEDREHIQYFLTQARLLAGASMKIPTGFSASLNSTKSISSSTRRSAANFRMIRRRPS